jgi:hypothetical protein
MTPGRKVANLARSGYLLERAEPMSESLWATWYDLDEDDRPAFIAWLHGVHLPALQRHPGIHWVAHYRSVGTGPALARYHDVAGHAPDAEGLGIGSQFLVLAAAPSTPVFYDSGVLVARWPQPAPVMLGHRRGLRTAVLLEEARVTGPAFAARPPGAVPAPAIQFGTYRVRNVEAELDLGGWYTRQRLPLMSRMPGSVMTRKFVSSAGWAKHSILYEFESLEARTRHFEEPEESKAMDPQEWTGRVVRTTLHTPGSPFVGERLWPPVAKA